MNRERLIVVAKILAGAGMLRLVQILPYICGANLGTTNTDIGRGGRGALHPVFQARCRTFRQRHHPHHEPVSPGRVSRENLIHAWWASV
jgi:hypothetical protein